MRRYTRLIHRVVTSRNDVSVAQLADLLGKRESTLYAELNSWRETPGNTAKLGFDDALRIALELGDRTLIQAICRDFGLATAEAAYTPDKGTLNEEMLDDFPPVVDFQNAMREGLPVDKTAELCEAAVCELRETQAMYEEEQGK